MALRSLFGQRLYVRIWVAVVAAVALLTVVVGSLWQIALDNERDRLSNRTEREIIIRNSAGDIVGQSPAMAIRVPGQGLEFQVETKEGDTLYVQLPRRERSRTPRPGRRTQAWLQSPSGFAWVLGSVAVAVALGAYPIVRRLTKRLEGLQKGVERWGQGDLSARMPEDGQDEVAFLAQRFNVAAERVETLLASHKTMLANASHELRSPLTRIRMGLELSGDRALSPAQRTEIRRNIEELDQLIDEILLASRLDAKAADDASALGAREDVDMVGLVAEECARVSAELDILSGTDPAIVNGSAKLLRRVVRNLLENARRYGRSAKGDGSSAADGILLSLDVIEPQASKGAGTANRQVQISVEDRGPGVPVALREKIFEPFYRLPGASESVGGVGLGLSLVKRLVERHGGQVQCEDRNGGGARFVVLLPAVPPA
ncbi:HAMP domain-containing sensor histidine kinase [Hydrogenophaga sp. 5NK40-0174]|uniref:HAMP domain-containing sensor histidine kinase n=1 Tax=Hydrogenophaga sp. 5NK40-0174 TaxID=3127649 RepID=UPI0031095422